MITDIGNPPAICDGQRPPLLGSALLGHDLSTHTRIMSIKLLILQGLVDDREYRSSSIGQPPTERMQ